MNNILPSILTLTGLGILFGISLAYAAKKFHVPVDPTLEKVLAKLPGANCGACGKAGCAGFAEALLHGELDLHSCSVAAQENKKSIAEFLGLDLEQKDKMVAVLHCCGGNRTKDKFLYEGMKDCLAASLVLGGQKECKYGCLTHGTCVRACAFDAIEMTGESFPKVVPQKCTACRTCIHVCPKSLYSLIPLGAKIFVACSSHDMGRDVMKVCPVGCIGCRKCEKTCPHDAIHVIENVARVDYVKCTGCLACVGACPTKVIKQR